MGEVSPLVVIVVGIIMGLINAACASRRGRSPTIWFAAGFLAGLMALCVLYFLPKVQAQQTDQKAQPTAAQPDANNKAASASALLIALKQEWYFLNAEHQQHGPVPYDVLKSHWKEGTIAPNTFVWCNGMDNWQPISAVPSLAKSIAD